MISDQNCDSETIYRRNYLSKSIIGHYWIKWNAIEEMFDRRRQSSDPPREQVVEGTAREIRKIICHDKCSSIFRNAR